MEEEIKKKCFKCGRELPLSEFYVHPQMKDGHLNKCKDCAKRDVQILYSIKSQDEEWMERERKRGREKRRKYHYTKSEAARIKTQRYPQSREAKRYWRVRTTIPNGFELHHWNYHLPFDVIMLPRRIHHRVHWAISFNLEEGIYYYNGEALDTIEKHLEVVDRISKDNGYSEPIKVLLCQ